MFMGTTPFITVGAEPTAVRDRVLRLWWRRPRLPATGWNTVGGFLVMDIFPVFSGLSDAVRAELSRLGSRAFWAAELGLVHLVQERVGLDQFAYIAVVRPKPKAAAVSLSELLLAEQGQPCDATGSSGRAAA